LAIVGVEKNPEAPAMLAATEKAGIEVVGPFFMNEGTDDEYREVFATMVQSGANALPPASGNQTAPQTICIANQRAMLI
jgi:putative tryptophan/tyrosine transport system substrate-binding protein